MGVAIFAGGLEALEFEILFHEMNLCDGGGGASRVFMQRTRQGRFLIHVVVISFG